MTGLSPSEIEIVRMTLAEAFGDGAKIWLFGSRGQGVPKGDVDLFVETVIPAATEVRLKARRRLESRLHQKVDLVVRARGEQAAAIDAIARATGVPL